MGIELALALIFLVLVVGVLLSLTVRLWRGDVRVADNIQLGLGVMPFRSDIKRGIVRGIAPLVLQLILVITAVCAAVIGMANWHGGSKFTPWTLAAAMSLVAAMASFSIHLFVIYYNKPRWLVPPFLRDEPGVSEARRRVANMEPPPTLQHRKRR